MPFNTRSQVKFVAFVLTLVSTVCFGQSYPHGSKTGTVEMKEVSINVFSNSKKESRTIKIPNMNTFVYSTSHVPAYGGISGSLMLFSGEQEMAQGICTFGYIDGSLLIPVNVVQSTMYNNEIVLQGEQIQNQTKNYDKPESMDVFVYANKESAHNGVSISFNCDYEKNGVKYMSFNAQHYGIVRLEPKK